MLTETFKHENSYLTTWIARDVRVSSAGYNETRRGIRCYMQGRQN